jgi:BirA family transcriptional regulator, biotin operon repressor / biotin---[acetyl-CoA-carboxylase] ligase
MPLTYDAEAVSVPVGWSVSFAGVVTSTQSLIRASAMSGAPSGTAVLADVQTAGRGRRDRTWQAPPRTSLLMSWLWRPDPVPASRWGWLPLLVGVAVCDALRDCAALPLTLKWPNDVLAVDVAAQHRPGKVGGVLVERIDTPLGAAAVIGSGLNVSQDAGQLPVDTATSLRLAGASTLTRVELLAPLLSTLHAQFTAWCDAAGDAQACGLAEAYRRHCATIGRRVVVHLPGDVQLAATAVRVDDDGRLVVRAVDGEHVVGAGDVVHVR